MDALKSLGILKLDYYMSALQCWHWGHILQIREIWRKNVVEYLTLIMVAPGVSAPSSSEEDPTAPLTTTASVVPSLRLTGNFCKRKESSFQNQRFFLEYERYYWSGLTLLWQYPQQRQITPMRSIPSKRSYSDAKYLIREINLIRPLYV